MDIMGTKVALIICRAREKLRSLASPPLSGWTGALSETDAFEIINSIFGYSTPIIPAGLGSVVSYPETSLPAYVLSFSYADRAEWHYHQQEGRHERDEQ